MRRRKVLRARRWYSAFSREERAQLSRRRAPAPSKSAASPAATAERMPTIAPSSPSAASAIAPPANAPPSAAAIAAAFTPVVIQVLRATGHARLPLLQLPLQPPFFRFNERHHRATSALSTDDEP